jgi:hypothetical protein
MQLKVSFAKAQSLLQNIPHKICQKSISVYWDPYYNHTTGDMGDPAICWLFCWATTGMNSLAAEAEAQKVFDQIFPMTYSKYDVTQAKIVAPLSTYEWAKKIRKHI